jgi:hypothetical protein
MLVSGNLAEVICGGVEQKVRLENERGGATRLSQHGLSDHGLKHYPDFLSLAK